MHVLDDHSVETIRFFRVEQTYAVKTGKWYFEFEVLSGGDMRVGWARPGCRPDVELGSDDQAYVFDGYRVNLMLWHIEGHASFNSHFLMPVSVGS